MLLLGFFLSFSSPKRTLYFVSLSLFEFAFSLCEFSSELNTFASMASTQFDVAGNSNPVRKVRVVAKIRGFSGPETNSGTSRTVDWVSVNRENPEDVTISFKEQSSRYAWIWLKLKNGKLWIEKEIENLLNSCVCGS